jgi:hypothetical protein
MPAAAGKLHSNAEYWQKAVFSPRTDRKFRLRELAGNSKYLPLRPGKLVVTDVDAMFVASWR